MPQKNIDRYYQPEHYYHVYNHSVAELQVLYSHTDAKYFLGLLTRYLGQEITVDKNRQPYKNFSTRLKLLSYCLMSNHFHLLLYQTDVYAIQEFMQSLVTAYSKYFNIKYVRRGAVFESRYKASSIDNDIYLQHLIKYINQNPVSQGDSFEDYPFSSHLQIAGLESGYQWLAIDEVTKIFSSTEHYLDYMSTMLDFQKADLL